VVNEHPIADGIASEIKPVSAGFGAIERVIDHGRQQERRRDGVCALQPPCHRIEQLVQVAVDLGMLIHDKLRSLVVRGPFVEEMQRGREIREFELAFRAREPRF
jgi:hypothetical protein